MRGMPPQFRQQITLNSSHWHSWTNNLVNMTTQSLKKVKFLCPSCTNSPISFEFSPELDKSLMKSNPAQLTLWLCGLFEVGFKPQRESLPLCAQTSRPRSHRTTGRSLVWQKFWTAKDLMSLRIFICLFYFFKAGLLWIRWVLFHIKCETSSGAELVTFQGGCLVAVGEKKSGSVEQQQRFFALHVSLCRW